MKWLDRIALVGMGLGIALFFVPCWDWSLKFGFFVTLGFTVLHIVTSHLVASPGS